MDLSTRQITILEVAQIGFPVVSRPYMEIADKLGLSEEDVIEDLRSLKELGFIKQISIRVDIENLGFNFSLVKLKLNTDSFDESIRLINAHPGVNRSLLIRDKEELWFSLTTPPNSPIENHIDLLKNISYAKSITTLQTIKLNSTIRDSDSMFKKSNTTETKNFSETELNIIRELQEDLPLVSRPFLAQAIEAQCSEDEILTKFYDLQENSYVKNISAIMNPKYDANDFDTIVVLDTQQNLDSRLADISMMDQVIECVHLQDDNDKSDLFFTTLKANPELTDSTIKLLSQAPGIKETLTINPSDKYKNIHVRYFTPEWDAYLAKFHKELSI